MTTRLLLKNANVVLPDRELHGSVLVVDGAIAAVGDDVGPPAQEVDLAGTTLLPGFIDFHIHGAVGVDVMDASADGLRDVCRYLASQGVTAWLPTIVPGTDDAYAHVAAVAGECLNDQSGARVLGLHYEGPFVNSAQCGALHVEHFKTYSSPADLARLRAGDGLIRMTTLAPEVSGGIELIRELKRRDWVISIGHTRATLDVLDQAFAAGARHMTHFMNAMAPLHHRHPGPIAWGLAHEDVSVDVIADGIHLDPFMLRLLVRIKGVRAVNLISDAIAAAGKGDGDYNIWGETISVKNGRTANRSGSIAGSVISMLDAVRLMLSLGVSYVDLAQLAATNPARLLGVGGECGSIETGKRADLVAVDRDGNVRLTLIGGNIAYQ